MKFLGFYSSFTSFIETIITRIKIKKHPGELLYLFLLCYNVDMYKPEISKEPTENGADILSDIPPFNQDAAERAKEEAELLRASELLRGRKHDAIVARAKQEQAERDFNAELTTIEDLDDAILAEEDGISKTFTEYDGKKIPVYNLTGYNIKFIQHMLAYKLFSGRDNYNSSIARSVIADPSIWASRMADLPKPEKAGDSYGFIVSGSYMNTETNYAESGIVKNTRSDALFYGFSSLRPNSLVVSATHDVETPNAANISDSFSLGLFRSPQYLDSHSDDAYNEVAFRRYDDQGEPIKPDFILAHSGFISEEQKRHAAFFDIPIVNIDSKIYRDRKRQESLKSIDSNLDSVSSESEYSEIIAAVSAIEHESSFCSTMIDENLTNDTEVLPDYILLNPSEVQPAIETIEYQLKISGKTPAEFRLGLDGLNQESPQAQQLIEKYEIFAAAKKRIEKINQLKLIEQEKRIALIKSKLEQAIQTGTPDPEIKYICHVIKGQPYLDRSNTSMISPVNEIYLDMLFGDELTIKTVAKELGSRHLYEDLVPLVDQYISMFS